MSTITATEVKKLRDSTGAGMMDAKRALTEADGDFDKAVEVLRVSGQAKAAKRAERSATNGLVASSDGALLQLGAETDFVAKNEEFQRLAADAVAAVAASRADSVEAANAAALPSGKTVAEAVEELAVKIGEKLEISAAAYFDGQTVVYLHRRASDLPPQVGVLVEYDGTDETAARTVAMQIAAMRPQYLSRDEVPTDLVENERRIAGPRRGKRASRTRPYRGSSKAASMPSSRTSCCLTSRPSPTTRRRSLDRSPTRG
jgi:elongation factor Ts